MQHQALSLTAVFVALAVGVAAGAAAVGSRLGGEEELVRGIEQKFDMLQARLREATARERRLRGTLALYEEALENLASAAASAYLAGAEVQVEASSGAEGAAGSLRRALEQAGARVRVTWLRAGEGPAALLVKSAGRTVAGLVGPPPPGSEAGLPPVIGPRLAAAGTGPAGQRAGMPGTAAVPAPQEGPVAWTWEAESAGGRVALMAALACGERGPVDVRRAVERLAEVAGRVAGAGGERGGACP